MDHKEHGEHGEHEGIGRVKSWETGVGPRSDVCEHRL